MPTREAKRPRLPRYSRRPPARSANPKVGRPGQRCTATGLAAAGRHRTHKAALRLQPDSLRRTAAVPPPVPAGGNPRRLRPSRHLPLGRLGIGLLRPPRAIPSRFASRRHPRSGAGRAVPVSRRLVPTCAACPTDPFREPYRVATHRPSRRQLRLPLPPARGSRSPLTVHSLLRALLHLPLPYILESPHTASSFVPDLPYHPVRTVRVHLQSTSEKMC